MNVFKQWFRNAWVSKPTGEYEEMMALLAQHKGDPKEALRAVIESGQYLYMKMDVLNRLHILAYAEDNFFKIKVDLL